MWKNKYASDYYRMTGELYKAGIKTWIRRITHHNINYMYWWRKNAENKTLLTKVMLYKMSRKYGIEIGNAQIGEGLYIGHPYNITVNETAVLGKNINLHKGVTIGTENRGKRLGAPNIGDQVFVGVNATIVGKITIGDDVLIAPNSYVNTDVPSHSIVIGNPARVYCSEMATRNYINFIR